MICQGIKIKMCCLLQALAMPDFCIHFPGLPNHFSTSSTWFTDTPEAWNFISKTAEHHISKTTTTTTPWFDQV